MGVLRCRISLGVARVPPTEPIGRTYSAASGFESLGLSDWAVADEPSVNGDTILTDIYRLPETPLMAVAHFQHRLDGRVVDTLYGPHTNYERRIFGKQPPFSTSVEVRAIYRPKNAIIVDSFASINVGEIVSDPVTGSTARVVRKLSDNDDGNILLVADATGQFGGGNPVEVSGAVRTNVRTRSKCKDSFYVENASTEIAVGDTIVGLISGGSNYVQKVEYISGSAATGDWHAKINFYYSSGTQPILGEALSVEGTPVGNICDWGLRPWFDREEIESGSIADIAGPWSAPKSVACTIGAPSVEVIASHGNAPGEATAPAGIRYRAIARGFSVKDPLADLHFRWTFPETGAFNRISPTQGAASLWGRERSVGYSAGGAGFTHEQPGQAEVSVDVTTEYSSAVTATGSVTVSIDDPEAVFAGSDTVTFGDTSLGDDHNAIELGAIAGAISSGRKRLLLRGGLTYSNFSSPEGAEKLQIGPIPGTGEPSLAFAISARADAASGEFTIYGVRLDHGYAPNSTEAQPEPPDGISYSSITTGAQCTAHDIEMVGSGLCFRPKGPRGGGGTVMTNVRVADWYDYALLGGDIGAFGMFGVEFAQAGDALFSGITGSHKNEAGPPRISDHGPIRYSHVYSDITHDLVSLFTNGSWNGGGSDCQPNMRLNENGLFPCSITASRLYTEGSSFELDSGSNPGKRQAPARYVFDKWMHLTTKTGDRTIQVGAGGATIKNFKVVVDDVIAEGDRAVATIFRFGAANKNEDGALWFDASTQRTRIYNGTVVDLRVDRNMTGNNNNLQSYDLQTSFSITGSGEPLGNVEMWNVLEHRPNVTTDRIEAFAPLDDTPGFTPYYQGRREHQLIKCGYADCNGFFQTIQDSLTCAATGARARIRVFSGPDSGSFGAGSATGDIYIIPFVGSFAPGDVLTHDNEAFTLTLTSVEAPSQLLPEFANSTLSTASYRPQAGSAAIGGATGITPHDDFFCTPRPAAASIGAIEP